MTDIISAAIEGAGADELAALPMPESYKAAYVERGDIAMFEGLESDDKDPRKSLKVGEVDLPELAPDEAYVLIMASSINFNTVWTSIFEPLPTFGFLAEIAVVKANQLMPKPTHLTWEESAINALCNSTAYRMVVSPNGAGMTQGDKALIWGASGGLGAYAVQHVLNGGGTPVGVVSSASKVALLNELGVDAVIDRKEKGYRFWSDEFHQDESEWRRLGKDIRGLVGEDVDFVFEHPGRQTMGASVFVTKRGGKIVTCAATSGYMIEYDNRHLWMKLKSIIGSHFANYREAWEANQLICDGVVLPPLSAVYTLDEVGDAAYQVHKNLHEGKIGVLCAAPAEGLGIDDPEKRAAIGEDRLTIFRRHA